MWWHEFAEYVWTASESRVDFSRDILPQIRQLILLSFEASRPYLWEAEGGGSGRYGHKSFNLFGFDFMIDANFKVSAGAVYAGDALAHPRFRVCVLF